MEKFFGKTSRGGN